MLKFEAFLWYYYVFVFKNVVLSMPLFHITFQFHSTWLDADNLTWVSRFAFSTNRDKKILMVFILKAILLEPFQYSIHHVFFVYFILILAEIILFYLTEIGKIMYNIKLDYCQILFHNTFILRNQNKKLIINSFP